MFNVLVIGCGMAAGGYDEMPDSVGVKTHAAAYHRHPGFSLKACVEPNEKRRRKFMERWQIQRGYGDITRCLAAETDIHVASVCSPTAFHSSDLEALRSYGIRGVFCEKPLTDDLSASEHIVAAYREAGIPLAVNYLRRWNEDIVAIARQVQNGDWGRPVFVSGSYTGGLLHNGSHMVDLLRMFFDDVHIEDARFRRMIGDRDSSCDIYIGIGNEGGGVLAAVDGAAYSVFELVLQMEYGVIQFEDWGRILRLRRMKPDPLTPGRQILALGESKETAWNDAMLFAVQNFHDHLSNGQALASDGESALVTQRFCEQARTRAHRDSRSDK